MAGAGPVEDFVRDFHRDLTHWFAGTDDEVAVWQRIVNKTPADMVLVYPSGQRLTGSAFLESICGRYGGSLGFEASIAEVEVIAEGERHAVVSYVESQRGARNSTTSNQRSALAVLVRDGDAWRWRFIQETALPSVP